MKSKTSTTVQKLARAAAFCSLFVLPQSMASVIYDGVEFPQGDLSFADLIQAYNPVSNNLGNPIDLVRNPDRALGAPLAPEGTCNNAIDCSFVSLGSGGSIVLQFVDNFLTGSNSSALDLWIFEIGPDVEDTFVEISKNGTDWFDVGKVFGNTAGIDIDFFGFTSSDLFSFVRLTDDPNEGEGFNGSATVGADIDAVGAITTIFNPGTPPDPNTVNAPTALTSALFAALIILGLRKSRAGQFTRA